MNYELTQNCSSDFNKIKIISMNVSFLSIV